jgi:hypothetical protein
MVRYNGVGMRQKGFAGSGRNAAVGGAIQKSSEHGGEMRRLQRLCGVEVGTASTRAPFILGSILRCDVEEAGARRMFPYLREHPSAIEFSNHAVVKNYKGDSRLP